MIEPKAGPTAGLGMTRSLLRADFANGVEHSSGAMRREKRLVIPGRANRARARNPYSLPLQKNGSATVRATICGYGFRTCRFAAIRNDDRLRPHPRMPSRGCARWPLARYSGDWAPVTMTPAAEDEARHAVDAGPFLGAVWLRLLCGRHRAVAGGAAGARDRRPCRSRPRPGISTLGSLRSPPSAK